MQTTPSSKPFAAWATALTDKYRFNPFVRTTVHIILLQTLLAIVMIGVFVWGVRFAQESTVASITRSIMDAMSSGTTSIETLPESIEEVRQDTYTFMLIGVILLNALFGYLLTRFALRPTRNSLGSQKQFIGNVAHEIRTPLAIMKTNTEVALFDPNLAPAVKQTFEDTLVELDRVSEIINNLLTFDTLTRPRRMQFEPVDLAAVAETIRARHEALARERGIALRTDISGESMIDGNATALEQVVTNLVKNALNYTPQH
ncbi:MAG TPA: HAMP domain-containing sensor histidine kinase, partial [Candidatus Paceibacterota bacterium]|nr:HAMP domain-containing sensor histidine kinase [Candidatus Paceibacterota bacterium]